MKSLQKLVWWCRKVLDADCFLPFWENFCFVNCWRKNKIYRVFGLLVYLQDWGWLFLKIPYLCVNFPNILEKDRNDISSTPKYTLYTKNQLKCSYQPTFSLWNVKFTWKLTKVEVGSYQFMSTFLIFWLLHSRKW